MLAYAGVEQSKAKRKPSTTVHVWCPAEGGQPLDRTFAAHQGTQALQMRKARSTMSKALAKLQRTVTALWLLYYNHAVKACMSNTAYPIKQPKASCDRSMTARSWCCRLVAMTLVDSLSQC